MSAPSTADIHQGNGHVRLVPTTDIGDLCLRPYVPVEEPSTASEADIREQPSVEHTTALLPVILAVGLGIPGTPADKLALAGAHHWHLEDIAPYAIGVSMR